MPFPGIVAGSALEKKIDRCVEQVMATGRDKSAAIAICRSSLAGKQVVEAAAKNGPPLPEDNREILMAIKDHSGAIISLTVPGGVAQVFALADEGALPASELHITLAYLGKAADLSAEQIRHIHGVVEGVSYSYRPLQGAINGAGRFCNNDPDGDAFFIIPDMPQLPALRQDLVERLEAKGIPVATNHGYVPHITLMYLPHEADNPFSQVERMEGLVTPSISLSLGAEKFDYPFRVETTKDKATAIEQANYRAAGPASTQICATCQFGANEARVCSLFDFTYDDDFVCDEWLPDIAASRERLQVLQAENKARLDKRKAYMLAAELRIALKRSSSVPVNEAKERIVLKREIAGQVRRDLSDDDFVFPETRSFPIQKPVDVRAAVMAWGRATAVRARGFTFDDFKRRLIRLARRKGAAFVAMLPLLWGVDQKGTTGEPSTAYAHGPGGLFSPLGLGRRKKGSEGSEEMEWLMVSEAGEMEMEDEYKAATRLGRFLRQRRIEEGLSLPQLGQKMPISASTIGQIERGEIGTPSEPVLLAFARALMIPKMRIDSLLRANAAPRQEIARNAITGGKESQAKQGPPHSKQAEPLEHIAPQRGKNFSVFKDARGQYRWVMVSSSAYVDRDGEIVSTKALTNAVAQLDTEGERGPLLWWHLPIRLGTADFGMMHKRMLIESGGFVSEPVGEAIARKTINLGGSIGFRHPKTEPDAQGVFNTISQFERSLLPRDKASNFFTSLTVKEQGMSMEKIYELIDLVGAEQAAALLGNISATDKQAQENGFAYKGHDDLAVLTADQLADYAVQMKEYEVAEAEAAAAAQAAQAEEGDDIMVSLKAIMDKLSDHDEAIKSMAEMIAAQGKQEGEAAAMVEADEADEGGDKGAIADMLQRIMAMLEKHDRAIGGLMAEGASGKQSAQKESEVLQERLGALEADQPRAVVNGYRASQKGTVVEDDKKSEPVDQNAEMVEQVKEALPGAAPFAEAANSFVRGLPGQQGHPYWGQVDQGPPAVG